LTQPERKEVLVLRAGAEAYEAPGEVVVNWRLRAGRHDEREERQRPVGRAEEQPLADAEDVLVVQHQPEYR